MIIEYNVLINIVSSIDTTPRTAYNMFNITT